MSPCAWCEEATGELLVPGRRGAFVHPSCEARRASRRSFLLGTAVLAGAAVAAPVLAQLPEESVVATVPILDPPWPWVRSLDPLVFDAEGSPLTLRLMRRMLNAAQLQHGRQILDEGNPRWVVARERWEGIVAAYRKAFGHTVAYPLREAVHACGIPFEPRDENWPLDFVGLFTPPPPRIVAIDYAAREATIDVEPLPWRASSPYLETNFAVQVVNLATDPWLVLS